MYEETQSKGVKIDYEFGGKSYGCLEFRI